MATAPRPGAAKEKETEAATITVNVDGTPYVCRPAEVTARIAGDLRRQSGLSVRGVMAAAGEDPDLDTIASLVWIARRQAGEYVTWDEVADGITYTSDISSSDEAPTDEDPDSPEA